MAAFSFAVSQLLEQEGELVDDPYDEGGLTNFGISFRFYKSIIPNATPEDLRVLTRPDAIELYQKYFWNESRWAEINSQIIANVAFDMHVNMGLAPATKIIQRSILAVYGDHNKILDDGIFGEQTLHFVNNTPADLLTIAIRSERAGYYREIALRNPTQQKELDGWLNRAYKL